MTLPIVEQKIVIQAIRLGAKILRSKQAKKKSKPAKKKGSKKS